MSGFRLFSRKNGIDEEAEKDLLNEDSPSSPSSPPPLVQKRSTFLGRLINGSGRSPSPSSKPLQASSSSSSNRENSLPPLSPLTLKGYRASTKHRLLDDELADNIRNLLPARLQLFDEWELTYSLEQHGISLNTLYRNCDPEYQLEQKKKHQQQAGFGDSIIRNMVIGSTSPYNNFEAKRPQGYVLIIKDEKNSKFGCFLNQNLKPMDHKRYYGNGECFLWKCENYNPSTLTHSDGNLIDLDSENAEPQSSLQEKTATRFKAFMYTGLNDNIIYSNHDFISVGSSNGQNGLYIDKSLYKGVSYSCDTFGNEILNSSNPDDKIGRFKIIGLEVWRVGSLD
ncbi:TLD-domain-containing protein [Scheffersomyces xylosifermentans]|uniref:TLD-domain-containing protein n=1 Tax=Scheffersomyces xylosifermentans TaxID=1304137 RepID=UPI00315DFC43